MGSDPTRHNRLGDEESPYLRQHADNPVNWQPWDDVALEAARERDVPIFLSIGYAACHWCHVMADESFEDDAIAAELNEHFLPIKVDREERPDVDSIYMTVCQLVTGRGGWPLSAWLTPDGKPFFVGTYYPPRSRGGHPGFLEVLRSIRSSWETDRETLEERAEEWTDAVRTQLEPATAPESGTGTPPGGLLHGAASAAVRSADREHGGFGRSGPKFPQPSRLALLARAAGLEGRADCEDVLTESLDAMAAGGLTDHVGGGFHRYCVDRDWTVPHFEKMLYDNASLPLVYLDGYRLTGDERYASVARDALSFVERELTHPDGGVFSTLDAQSEGESGEREEGAFYVWTPDAVRDAIDDETTASLVCEHFGVTEAGNFEGATVLTRTTEPSALAADHELSVEAVRERLETGRRALFDARAARPRPPRDEKVLAGWNGLLIDAAATAGIVLGEGRWTRQAEAALSFVREHCWDGDTLSRRYARGDVAIDGYLEDYAFLARGALRVYEATGAVDALAFALDLADGILERFWDETAGTLYFTPADGESLVSRPEELTDGSTPSATGVAATTLLALDGFTTIDLVGPVERLLDTHRGRVEAAPLEHASLATAADRLHRGLEEVTIAATSIPDGWRAAIARDYRPDLVIAPRPPDEAGLERWLEVLGLEAAPPIFAGRDERGEEPTLYACRERTCSAPLTTVDEAIEWLDGRPSPL